MANSVDTAAPVSQLTQTVVLDTSVLVADPGAINEFSGCAVKVPLTVIEELDSLKTRTDTVGHTAREALRRIEALRVSAGGSLAEPLTLAHGGTSPSYSTGSTTPCWPSTTWTRRTPTTASSGRR